MGGRGPVRQHQIQPVQRQVAQQVVKLAFVTQQAQVRLGYHGLQQTVHDEFNERADEENLAMAWGWSSVSSWYKNDLGRVSQNWPFTIW